MSFNREVYPNLAVVARVHHERDRVIVEREVTSSGIPLEHDDRVDGPQFRNRKGRGFYRGYRVPSDGHPRLRPRGGGHMRVFGGPVPRLRFQDDADLSMSDGGPQLRLSPYGRPYRRDDWRSHQDRRGGGRGGGRGGWGEGHRGFSRWGGGRNRSWFKMTIPHGKQYDKKWLLTSLQNVCSVPFTPVQYHTDGHRVQFYVDDASAAKALHGCSRKITSTDGYIMMVHMNACDPPSFILADLKPEDLEHLKQCMAKRFDSSQQALDLNNIRTDPDLVSQNIEVILNRRTCMEAVVKIIEENIPELVSLNLSQNRLHNLDELSALVSKAPNLNTLNLSHNELKSERDLDRLKGLKLVELWLEHNPLCDLFKDQPSYISAVRQRLPKLLKLDGHNLPPPIGFDVETPTTIPPCKGSCFGSDEIKVLILRFLQQYYSIYDAGDRQPLLDAYHDGASFSLSSPFSNQSPSRGILGEYHKDNRNLKRIKETSARFRLLKHTRVKVVSLLNELPKTQHDTASFNVDVNTYTSTLLSFTVSGVFREVDDKSGDSVRAFSRVFIAVPAGNSGLCIVNDQLFVRNATAEEVRRSAPPLAPPPAPPPAPTPSSSPVPSPAPGPSLALAGPQLDMLSAFSLTSGMNLEWSQKCLQDNEWDFNRAAQIFTQLKTDGKIPDVAFIK